MKKVIFLIVFVFLLFCILLGISTNLFGNLWCKLTGLGFFIPKESNMFIFEVTKWNDGSGEWWLYGEDKNYYYGLNNIDELEYYIMKKGNEDKNFNKFDYKTWDKKEY
jgi:hypothetical protein